MKYVYIRLVLIATLLSAASINAQQTETEQVKKVVEDLFTGMKEGDSSLVSSLFRKDVRMLTSYTSPEGQLLLKEGSLQDFLIAIGTPHPNVWNEKIWNTEIKIDDNLAQVWTDYAFYVDDKFSHCGVDAFQLTKGNDGRWKIVHLIDTRRKSPCETP